MVDNIPPVTIGNEFGFISHSDNYPTDGKHLTLNTPIPCDIRMGDDTFWFNNDQGQNVSSKPCLWYVHFPDHPIKFKAFQSPEKAYTYASQQYIIWLQQEIINIQQLHNEGKHEQ